VRVKVELDARSYEILVTPDARHELAGLLAERAPRAQLVAVVTSASLAARDWFHFDVGRAFSLVMVPEGEGAKTMTAAADVLESLAELGLSRQDVVVAVGGGAITDLAGFVAATYLRGVALVNVPTSLVGQVDAAIGGKTGVNLRAGKNLAGAFHQPLGVLCDTRVLATLPRREWLSGLGEVAKCWLLAGRSLADLRVASPEDLVECAVRLKAELVSRDERESGPRVLLNYGHTLAHALEKIAQRQGDDLRHGEAVAVGLAFAVRLARRLGRVGDDVVHYHDEVLAHLELSFAWPIDADTDTVLEVMTHDKKAHHDLSFVLAGENGFELVPGVDENVVREVLDEFRGGV